MDEIPDDPCRNFSDVPQFWARIAHRAALTTSKDLTFDWNEPSNSLTTVSVFAKKIWHQAKRWLVETRKHYVILYQIKLKVRSKWQINDEAKCIIFEETHLESLEKYANDSVFSLGVFNQLVSRAIIKVYVYCELKNKHYLHPKLTTNKIIYIAATENIDRNVW